MMHYTEGIEVMTDPTAEKRKDYQLEFYAYESVGGSHEDEDELNELRKTVFATDDVEAFRGQTSQQDREKTRAMLKGHCGYTVIKVLPQLIGLKLSNLVLGYLLTLRPSAIRITGGEVNCDCCPWRVSVFVDENDLITDISQEVQLGYGCGADMDNLLTEAKTGMKARPFAGSIGHTAALARIDFQ